MKPYIACALALLILGASLPVVMFAQCGHCEKDRRYGLSICNGEYRSCTQAADNSLSNDLAVAFVRCGLRALRNPASFPRCMGDASLKAGDRWHRHRQQCERRLNSCIIRESYRYVRCQNRCADDMLNPPVAHMFLHSS